MYLYSTRARKYHHVFFVLTLIVMVALVLTPLDGIYIAYADESTSQDEIIIPDQASIVTGDAQSGVAIEAIVNLDETLPHEQEVPEEINEQGTNPSTNLKDGTESENPEILNTPSDALIALSQGLSPQHIPNVDVETSGNAVTTTQDGVVSNIATVSAETGTNSASSDASLIVTGDAIAYANVVNIVNTNIFNSNGAIGFFNEVLGVDSLDLRNAFKIFDDTNAVSTLPCSTSVCGTEYTLTTSNTAHITNDIIVRADSGGNVGGSESTIYTGDAYATANIFNLANTTITDSQYLLIAFNNFGDYGGDIVLPGADALNTLFSANGNPLNTTITNTNSTTIENTLTVSADTDDNNSTGGTIITGDAYSDSSVQNIVNTNLFGGSDFLLALRVRGDWAGEIFGLPEGVSWKETKHGIVLYNTNSNDLGFENGTTVDTTNTATVQNTISVFALTGANKVEGPGIIQTGDAYATANVTNVTNTNILGQNWALLIFDIFGDWNGDLAFGRPDLWIGGSASSPNTTIMLGAEVTYTYTITNNGDAVATNVTLDHHFNGNEIVYASDSSNVQYTSDGAHGIWSLGTIAPHETKEIQFATNVHQELDRAKREIVSSATVRAYETDADTSDNTELLSIYSGKDGGSNGASKPARITLSKTSNVEAVTPGGSADYTITVTNKGGPLYKSILRDVLRNEAGATTSVQYWDLGTIHPDETISVTYTMEFADDTTFGMYTNSADVIGLIGHGSPRTGKSYDSPDATDTIYIGTIVPQVLGTSTTRCVPYLTTHLKYGGDNDPEEVRRLQTFLNSHLNYSLEVSGFFDMTTEIAVREFQSRYANEILNPWGLSRDSGYVYYTTQKKINEIQCNNEILFPLSEQQFQEMDLFKNFLSHSQTTAKDTTIGIAYASSEIQEPVSNSIESNMPVIFTPPEILTTETTTSKTPDNSLIESLILPIKRLFEWAKHKYIDVWF